MSFNFIKATAEDNADYENLPEIYELARNLDTYEFLVKNGKFYYVTKNEALKIWILKALHKQSARYTNKAYSKNYGNEISTLFGRHLKKALLKSEIKRSVEEALLINPYIKKLSNFSFKQEGSKVEVLFTVTTIYGEFEQEISYEKE